MPTEKGSLGESSDQKTETPATASIAQINKYTALHTIPPVAFGLEGITEVRAFRGEGEKAVGFFDNEDALNQEAMRLDSEGWNVYHTLNPVSPLLLSRSSNRIGRAEGTKAPDILKRGLFLIDFDPERPSGHSATDVEMNYALARGQVVRNWLREQGWPDPLHLFSGNGVHLRYWIELPNDDISTALVKACLAALAERFNTAFVRIDTVVSDAPRIARFIGTVARKGENTPERPHRRSAIIEAPTEIAVVSRELLEQLANSGGSPIDAPPTQQKPQRNLAGERPSLELLLQKAVEQIVIKGGRNNAGLWLLQQMRDNNYDKSDARAILQRWVDLANSTCPESVPYTLAEARGSLDSAYKQKKRAPWSNSIFQVTDDGVFAKDGEDDKQVRVCSRLDIVAHARDHDGEGWSSLLSFIDRDGVTKELLLESGELYRSGREYLSQLANAGLQIEPTLCAENLLGRYLKSAKSEGRVRIVDRIGWSNERFVLPDEVFGQQNGDQVFFRSTAPHQFKVAGTLDQWRGHVGRYCAGNTRLAFAVSCGFAGAVLPLLGRGGGGFHLRSASSVGKSTALRAAGSVLGGGSKSGFLHTWRSTANALEGLALAHNHCLLCLDELGQCDPRVAAEAVYLLANGISKGRMSRHVTMRQPTPWELLFLSSGEVSLADHVKSIDKNKVIKAGQEVRLIDVPADAGAGLGLFENLHGFASAREFADALSQAAMAFYGTPLRAFLSALVARRSPMVESARATMKRFAGEYALNAGPEVGRVADAFALVAAAGELATAEGITGWTPDEAISAAGTCFLAWRSNRGTDGSADAEAGVRAVRLFIQQHGGSRFEVWIKPAVGTKYDDRSGVGAKDDDMQQRVINRVGFKRKNPKTGYAEYMVFPEAFRSEICVGFDYKVVAAALAERDLLVTEGRHFTVRRSFSENPNTLVYAIRSTIMDG